MKRRKLLLGLVAAALAVTVIGTLLLGNQTGRSRGNDKAGDGTWLLTIDGYGVTEEEFLMFLSDQKAVTANYFWTNYQAQPDAAFWTSEFGGEIPLEYAKTKALGALITAKIQFILASERGILPYESYDEMLTQMAQENAVRAEKQTAGEVVYGLTEFTPFTYYQYLYTNSKAELEHSQRELSKPSEKELRGLYEELLEQLSLGEVYSYDVAYDDGRQEHVDQNDQEIGKEDSTTEDLIYNYFAYMEPGDRIQNYSFHGETADITYRGRTHQGYQTFEEAEETLRAYYARQELSEIIQSRAESAEVVLDQARFDAIQMP